jgi:DNA-directed RNA polymerase subunit M/transcription elongation factor TFIIS
MSKPIPIAPPCPRCAAAGARWMPFTSQMNNANAFHCAVCGHVWLEILVEPSGSGNDLGPAATATNHEPGPDCPRCHSPRTEKMPARSAADPEFDFFRCNACGHMWIAGKILSARDLAG